MTRLNLADLSDSVRLYMGAPGLLVLAGTLLALLRRDRLLLFALAGVVCGGLIFTITGARSFSRYYMPALVFAALLAGAALHWLAQRSSLLSAALLLGCAAYFSVFARSAYSDPVQLPLSEVDRIQYITGTSAGYGFGATAAFVAAQVAREPQAVVFGYDLPARDILHVGPEGFGLLRASFGVGALTVAVWLSRFPIRRRGGWWMFGAVAVFGLCTLTFGLSQWFWLSVMVLFLGGAADMISVNIRQTLIQLATPDHMRGRVSSVSMLFIGASTELGEA